MTVSRAAKYRPLLFAGLALIVLPFALRALGLSIHVTELDVIDDKLPGPPAVRVLLRCALGIRLCSFRRG